MSAYPQHLEAYVEARLVSENDLRAVSMLVSMVQRTDPSMSLPSDLFWLGCAFALAAFRDEHICVELSNVVVRRGESIVGQWSDDVSDWVVALSGMPRLVTVVKGDEESPRTPFVLDDDLLYVTRAWDEEVRVASSLTSMVPDRLEIILGGPGTGKTTMVARRIVDFFASTGALPPIALAAPTGKAAKRMSQAIERALIAADAPDAVRKVVGGIKTQTVHQLLGYNPRHSERRFKYHAKNTLPHSIVVVDETSMMSLSMMYRLLDALDPDSQLLLVGDHHQLASVDAGTVLSDIATCVDKPDNPVGSRITLLTEQHRFGAESAIARLARLVLADDADAAIQLMATETDPDFEWINPESDHDRFNHLVAEVTEHARAVIELAERGEVLEALKTKNNLQVLCAVRNGPFGVYGWNRLIETNLGVEPSHLWYPGRPVLVTSNDRLTGLSNGDVGVVCKGKDVLRVVAFSEIDRDHSFAVTRLPEVETVHALTIHKSQGSEYDHAVVVLPTEHSRILTRELLYTAITRSVTKLTIVATEAAVRDAINTPIRRATGLNRRL